MIKKIDSFLVKPFQTFVTRTEDIGVNISKFFLGVASSLCLMMTLHFATSQMINAHEGQITGSNFATEALSFSFFYILVMWLFVGNFYRLVNNVSDSQYGTVVFCGRMQKGKLDGIVWRLYGLGLLLTVAPAFAIKVFFDLGKLHDVWSYITLISDLSFVFENSAFFFLALAAACHYGKPLNKENFQKAYSQ